MLFPTGVKLPGASSGDSSLSSHQDMCHSLSVVGYSAPVCALLCYMEVRLGVQIQLICSVFAAMTDQ